MPYDFETREKIQSNCKFGFSNGFLSDVYLLWLQNTRVNNDFDVLNYIKKNKVPTYVHF